MASSNTKITDKDGACVENDSGYETVLHREVILDIIRTNGWPDASSSDHNELFSRKGWLSRFTVTLDPTTLVPGKTAKGSPTKDSTPRPAAEKQAMGSCFSSLLKQTEHQPPKHPPKRQRISIPIPKFFPKISVKVSHLQDMKASLKYMDDWLKTFANRNIFSPCTPALGQHSLSNSQGFYWVYDRCFIQMENEKSDTTPTDRIQDLSRLQKIAVDIDSFLSNQHPHRLQCSSKSSGQDLTGSSVSPHTHTYPMTCTIEYSANFTHSLTINLPAILRLLLPAYDRGPSVCQYKLAHLENNLLSPDGNISVSGASAEGLFGFKCNEDKSGKEIISFLVGNRERYVVWVVKVVVDVRGKVEMTEHEKLRRELEEEEWEQSLAEDGYTMIQG